MCPCRRSAFGREGGLARSSGWCPPYPQPTPDDPYLDKPLTEALKLMPTRRREANGDGER